MDSLHKTSFSTSPWRPALAAIVLGAFASPAASADPIISEFLADNETGKRDSDGEFQDWLELHNPDPDPVDLGGYFLTDNPTNRNKWLIPAGTILAPNEFLVIFASGKDRRIAGQELHTNFSLDDSGEYLGLIAPDGVTAVSEYNEDPLPPQFDDSSYGFEQTPVTLDEALVDLDAPCTALVPPDTTLGITWTAVAFDDAAWTAGTQGVGYDRGSGYESSFNLDVEAQMYNQNSSVYIRIPFTIDDPADIEDLYGLTLEIQYDDGFSAYLNGVRVTGDNAPVTPSWDSTAISDRSDADALDFATFDLSSHLNRLQVGPNLLAIHGMNTSADDENMLIRARLLAQRLESFITGPTAYFTTPTPGGPNGVQVDLPTSEVTISTQSKTFTTPFEVTLTSAFEDETIRYTTDGRVPNANSTEYTGPITIGNSTQIRARVFGADNAAGPLAMESYLRIDPTLASFSSPLPIVILDTWGRGDPDGNSHKDAFWAIIEPDPVTGRAAMTDPFQLETRAGLKRRGSSSFGWPKYSMTVEARNEEGLDKGVKPLGLPRESDWILSGRYQFDRALMRNDLMYRLSREIGEYAVRTRFVELIHNVNGGNLSYNGDYFGVYSLMEKIKRDDNRVNVARIDRRDSREPDVTGGYMFKKDRLDPGDSGFSVSGMGTFGWVEPKEREVTSAQRTWLQRWLNEIDVALNRPNWTNPTTGKHFTEYIDQDSWLRHHWLNTLAMNVDGFRLSGYYYKHRVDTNGGKLGAGAIWDFDRTMGSTDSRDNNPRQWDGTGDSSHTWNDGRYPWWGKVLRNPDFRQAHIDLWQELRKGAFSDENLGAITSEFERALDERDPAEANPGFPASRRTPASRNFSRWPQNPPTGGSFRLEVRNLSTWLRQRTNWIDQQYTRQPSLAVEPSVVSAGTDIAFSPQAGVTIYYTTDGTDPRLPGGAISPTATATSDASPVPFTVTGTTRITARAYDATPIDPSGSPPLTQWSGPVQGTFFVGPIANASNFVISEVHYAPLPPGTPEEIAAAADAADFEFIEMTNISPTDTIDLTDVHFEAGVDFTFTGSAITSLAPGERVLIVCNQAAFEARYGTTHSDRIAGEFAPTRLDNAGERLHLVDGLGMTIADFRYNDKAPWPSDAGNSGYSMILKSSAIPDPDYTSAANWRSSENIGGNPNESDSNPFVGAPLEDLDGDGLVKIFEHALGTSDDDPGDANAIFSTAVQSLRVDGSTDDYFTITFQRDLTADDVALAPEITTGFVDWSGDAMDVTLVSELNQGDGTALVTYRTTQPVPDPAQPQAFVRLRATLP